SLQTLELWAVVWAVTNWMTVPINIVSDSLYVVGIVERIEVAEIKEVQNKRLFSLMCELRAALRQRPTEYCVIHVRSHQWPVGLGEGNEKADQLVTVGQKVPLDDFQLARQAHERFHQNAKGLFRQFKITLEEAKGIVRACPTCGNIGPGLGIGVNPRGLKALEIWQMDVTHVSTLGRLKYVHVTIDTFSKMMWATPLPGEKAQHAIKHLTGCFAVMGVPEQVKTDNGPAYKSEKLRKFFQQWGIHHKTGITNVPTGQAIIERAHQVLKRYIER
ncbi:hypothetical protein N340_00512, partial [Tauraco erythrolophus]